MNKLLNFEWSFLNIGIRSKNKTPIIFTETFRTVINLSKTFLQTQSFFIGWNEKQMIFVLGGTGLKERKLFNFKTSTKHFTEDTKAISNYIYLLEHSVICFDSSIRYQLIATKRNPWVALYFQSTINYSHNTSTLPHCHLPCNYVRSLLAYYQDKLRIGAYTLLKCS